MQIDAPEVHRYCRATTATEVANAVGKIKGQVLKRLEHDIPEIRLYLNRPNPNIEGAMRRLDILERLATDLGGHVSGEGRD